MSFNNAPLVLHVAQDLQDEEPSPRLMGPPRERPKSDPCLPARLPSSGELSLNPYDLTPTRLKRSYSGKRREQLRSGLRKRSTVYTRSWKLRLPLEKMRALPLLRRVQKRVKERGGSRCLIVLVPRPTLRRPCEPPGRLTGSRGGLQRYDSVFYFVF